MNSAYVFFPGIIVHELGHYLACVLTGTRVREVRWFHPREAFVVHDKPKTLGGVLISLAPFLLNNMLGLAGWSMALSLYRTDGILAIFFAWMAFSLFLFSFPSGADALNAFNGVSASLQRKIFSGPLPMRLGWLVVSPFLFLPAILGVGLLILIERLPVFSWGWAIFMCAWGALG